MHWLFIAGLAGFALFLVITLLGLAFGMMVLGVIFIGRSASRIREFKLSLLGKAKEDI